MKLTRLDIRAVRNLHEAAVRPCEKFNILAGLNGSGKTSVLEAICFLGLGRSFRSHLAQPVINHEADRLAVFIEGESEAGLALRLGIEKDRQGKTTIRVNNENITSVATLAELLPLQMIHPDSDELVSGGPKLRRQFMDWGMFHVEHHFLNCWKRWQRLLKQRNAVLKTSASRDEVCIWDQEYTDLSLQLQEMRKNYIKLLQPVFDGIVRKLLAQPEIGLAYQPGWPQDALLPDLLHKNFYRDKQLGYTFYGPQRDDMLLLCHGRSASEILSRGEQKLAVVALRLAQGRVLKNLSGRQCVYLLDDFAAELDVPHRHNVIEMLDGLDAQVFLTTTSYEEVKPAFDGQANLLVFHVEHGKIKTRDNERDDIFFNRLNSE